MKKSSFITASFFALILGSAITLPNSSIRLAVETTAPQLAASIPDSGTAIAATSSAESVVVPVVPARAPVEVRVTSPQSTLVVRTVSDTAVHRSPPAIPTGISIPTISLNSKVIPVSTNSRGEMNVPNGSTSDIGWFSGGVIPGTVGTAVMDAHVFAGFSMLRVLKVGDDIYVTDANGQQVHFVVMATKTYALSELTPDMLFEETTGRHLNLITCAGSLTPDHTTYDHRLIVYAELAGS